MPWWLDEFRPMSWQHAVVVGLCAVAMAGFIVAGRRLVREPAAERRLVRWVAIPALLLQAVGLAWWLMPRHFDPANDLPLHLCDIMYILSPLALLTGHRWVRALLLCWGVTMSWLAFVIPTLEAGPLAAAAWPKFWLFWLGHTAIFGFGLYDVIVRRYRPGWADLLRVWLVTACLMAIVAPVNERFAASYWYIGRDDSVWTVDAARAFGPWPWRIGLLALTMMAAQVAVVATVRVLNRGRGGGVAHGSGSRAHNGAS